LASRRYAVAAVRQPEPIKVPFATVSDGRRHHFTWRRAAHTVVRAEGPERIAMGMVKQTARH